MHEHGSWEGIHLGCGGGGKATVVFESGDMGVWDSNEKRIFGVAETMGELVGLLREGRRGKSFGSSGRTWN